MTATAPGLTPRDSQILELLRGGAPVQRIVAIGRHRKSWTALHVGSVVAFHLEVPAPTLTVVPELAPPQPRKVADCGTPSGHARHRRLHEKACTPCEEAKRAYQQEWALRDPDAESRPVILTDWRPEPFDGEPTDVILTPAQADVLGEVCAGLTNPQIARRLGISEHTVKSHVRDAVTALGVHSRTHAVALVLGGQVRVQVRRSARDGAA